MLNSNTSKEKTGPFIIIIINIIFCLRGESEIVGVDICFFMEANLRLKGAFRTLQYSLFQRDYMKNGEMEKQMEG